MYSLFAKELRDSLYLHRPLPLHRENSYEASFPHKTVLDSKSLFDESTCFAQPAAGGTGSLSIEKDMLTLSAPLRADHWPEGASPDGDYSNFGVARLDFSFPAQSWQKFNRLHFWVRPRMRGARIAHLNVSIENCGRVALPDPYFREGATVFDVTSGEWNQCIWEFDAMPRDAVSHLSFYVFCSGHDISAASVLEYDFRDIRLEAVTPTAHELGWENPNPGIRLSTVGYWTTGHKTAIATGADCCFDLVNAASDTVLFHRYVEIVSNERGCFQLLDFSSFCQPGEYYLRSGSLESCRFQIDDHVERESLWKVLNFIFCERCGFPVPGKHGSCHHDVLAEHNGETISFGGGWHDAGDVSQQAAQTGEIVLALFQNARVCRDDELLYLRLMEEAQWGLDFILRTRFGDGYRATSAGATRYTDTRIGNFDDIPCRVHNHSFENFLFSGVEAYAAETLADYDAALASNALTAAREDFAFAEKEFAHSGVHPAHMFEHTYNSGLSQYYAVIVWAASCLYAVTEDPHYAQTARDCATRLIACQEQGKDAPVRGFFYRDETHRVIVHFNHQSREHQFMEALERLCVTQPEHPEKREWERAMVLYGEYLKAIAGNTAPYGMLPAGIHKTDEFQDAETFPYLHITCDYQQERENYRQQLGTGKALGNGFVLRNFPVWFSFRGNSAVMLSAGTAAAILARYFHDEALMQLAREQMYWMWGKNPFGQSLVYGAGSDYCRQYAVLCGECVGEVPVGVETLNNGDVPYWPQNNNATFREVWVGAASRWLMLCSRTAEGKR